MTKKLILLSCATAILAVGCVVVPDEGYYDGRYEPRYDRRYDDDHRRYDNDRQRWEYQQGKNRVELERRKREARTS